MSGRTYTAASQLVPATCESKLLLGSVGNDTSFKVFWIRSYIIGLALALNKDEPVEKR